MRVASPRRMLSRPRYRHPPHSGSWSEPLWSVTSLPLWPHVCRPEPAVASSAVGCRPRLGATLFSPALRSAACALSMRTYHRVHDEDPPSLPHHAVLLSIRTVFTYLMSSPTHPTAHGRLPFIVYRLPARARGSTASCRLSFIVYRHAPGGVRPAAVV
jgi:hypothetical protein